jgi:hypothetical protein
MREKCNIFTSPIAKFKADSSITKDRVTKEKHKELI